MWKIAECCYEIGTCKNEVIAWITKKNDTTKFWYPLCKDHLHFIIITKTIEIDLEQLQLERIRQLELRIYDKKKTVNWKMFLDWEELAYHSKIHTYDTPYGDINITIALKEHRKRKLQQYIKKKKPYMIKLNGLSEDMEEFILEQCDYYENLPHKDRFDNSNFFQSFYHTCVEMWSNGKDLSDKQLKIIYREYKKKRCRK